MFRGMVDKRCAQGYTVYHTNLRPESFTGATHYWEDGHESALPDVYFYQKEADKRMQYLADQGLVNALGFAWFMSVPQKPETNQNFVRHIVASYGALPILWTLAGEVAGYSSGTRGIWDTVWEKPKEENAFNVFNPHEITWYEAAEDEGAKQMGYMRSFNEKNSFHTLRPFMGCYKSGNPFSTEALYGMFQLMSSGMWKKNTS